MQKAIGLNLLNIRSELCVTFRRETSQSEIFFLYASLDVPRNEALERIWTWPHMKIWLVDGEWGAVNRLSGNVEEQSEP